MEIKRILKVSALVLAAVLVVSSVGGYLWVQSVLHKDPIYETKPPVFPVDFGTDGRPAILVFSKTNGFRHEGAIPAAREMLDELGAERGWSLFHTENAAVFTPELLSRVDVVVSNNASGDNTTEVQETALRSFVEGGGGFVGVHGAGGDFSFEWQYYVDYLIGAQFVGHIMRPQFQAATVVVEDSGHPATRHLREKWTHTEEWYSFESSPRSRGVNVLLSVDEDSYDPTGMFWFDLSMGDHPVTWNHCVGEGRIFYTALGHQASTYALPEFEKLVGGAIAWAARLDGEHCSAPIAAP